MSTDGIVFAALAFAAVGLLTWLGWRSLRPPPSRTAEEQRAATWNTIVADHLVDATTKSGRTPWL
jgi:threonine/homoserine/homoserine lactone efflux protein